MMHGWRCGKSMGHDWRMAGGIQPGSSVLIIRVRW
jgi:hypothetical protein